MKSSKPVNRRELRVVGTSPLSFDVKVGTTLVIKRFLPSKKSRPTIGSGFKTDAHVVYNGITKVGRLNPKDVAALNDQIPDKCKVVLVDLDRNILKVELP